MKILYSPQVNENNTIKYTFNNDKITVILNGRTDTFDFTGMPNVELNPQDDIETELDINPFVRVWRENGVLHLELLNFIQPNASYEERFPEWFEVKSDG